MTTFDEQMEEVYGPLPKFSEHKKGDQITYLDEYGIERTGTIIWVVAASGIVGKQMPPYYVVERNGAGNTWPDTVFFGDVVVNK